MAKEDKEEIAKMVTTEMKSYMNDLFAENNKRLAQALKQLAVNYVGRSKYPDYDARCGIDAAFSINA